MTRVRRSFHTEEKIRAVLSIWTERRSATEVCREMAISWALLDRWQNLAMEGLMKGLDARRPEKPAGINVRLEKLIAKQVHTDGYAKLENRLKMIQKKTG